MGNNQGNKETWATKISAWSTVAVAAATIALVVVTWRYVRHTNKLIDMQKQQFELVNRARLIAKIQGDIKGGAIRIENIGNLPAKDFISTWIMFQWEDGKVVRICPKPKKDHILTQEDIQIVNSDKVEPEEILPIRYSSDFNADEQVVFFIILAKYTGQGIDGFRRKSGFYFWDINLSPRAWNITGPLGSPHEEIINSMKGKLWQFLEKEN